MPGTRQGSIWPGCRRLQYRRLARPRCLRNDGFPGLGGRVQTFLDDVVLELTRIAFSDIIDFVEWDSGNVWFKESCEIPAEARRAIAKVTRTTNGSVGVSLHGKVRALDLLAQHLGMYDIRQVPKSVGSDASLLSDDELAQFIREERAAKAASDDYVDID